MDHSLELISSASTDPAAEPAEVDVDNAGDTPLVTLEDVDLRRLVISERLMLWDRSMFGLTDRIVTYWVFCFDVYAMPIALCQLINGKVTPSFYYTIAVMFLVTYSSILAADHRAAKRTAVRLRICVLVKILSYSVMAIVYVWSANVVGWLRVTNHVLDDILQWWIIIYGGIAMIVPLGMHTERALCPSGRSRQETAAEKLFVASHYSLVSHALYSLPYLLSIDFVTGYVRSARLSSRDVCDAGVAAPASDFRSPLISNNNNNNKDSGIDNNNDRKEEREGQMIAVDYNDDGDSAEGSSDSLDPSCFETLVDWVMMESQSLNRWQRRHFPDWLIDRQSLMIFLVSTLVAFITSLVDLFQSDRTVIQHMNLISAGLSAISATVLIVCLRGWITDISVAIATKSVMFGVKILMTFVTRLYQSHSSDSNDDGNGNQHWRSEIVVVWSVLSCVSAVVLAVLTFTLHVRSKSRLKSGTLFSKLTHGSLVSNRKLLVNCIGLHWWICQISVLLVSMVSLFLPIHKVNKANVLFHLVFASQMSCLVPSKVLNYAVRRMWDEPADRFAALFPHLNFTVQMMILGLIGCFCALTLSVIGSLHYWIRQHGSLSVMCVFVLCCNMLLPLMLLGNLVCMKKAIGIRLIQIFYPKT